MTSGHLSSEVEPRTLRSALFVDFDNVYLGLGQLEPEAAKAFALNPSAWLDRLAWGQDAQGGFTRRFLVRACYLNPSVHSSFRPFFTRAGFRVVDCPSLTRQGKSSADINLVLDAVDVLARQTRYDEVIIASSDADFTPLALRCREADRRVAIIAAGPAAGAYRAVADEVIDGDQLADIVLRGVDSFVTSAAPQLTSLDLPMTDSPSELKAPVTSEAVSAVRQLIVSASGPVVGSAAANVAASVDPNLPLTGWGGLGFSGWMARHLPEVGAGGRAPGYFWDRARFSDADLPDGHRVEATPLQREVVAATDVPLLDANQYRTLISTLADDVNTHDFHRNETCKRVRDSCHDAGVPIGRAAVNYVIQGLLYSGARMEREVLAEDLAEAWTGNVIGLCRGARMDLDARAEAEIRSWVSGGLAAANGEYE